MASLGLASLVGRDAESRRATGRSDEAAGPLCKVGVFENEDGHPFSVIAPDLGDPHLGVDGQLAEGRAGDMYLDDQIRRRVHGRIYAALDPDSLLVLEVEAGVGLEAAPQVFTPEGPRTEIFGFDA